MPQDEYCRLSARTSGWASGPGTAGKILRRCLYGSASGIEKLVNGKNVPLDSKDSVLLLRKYVLAFVLVLVAVVPSVVTSWISHVICTSLRNELTRYLGRTHLAPELHIIVLRLAV
eukprot:3139829-Rhodomonas_salina.1